MISIIVPTIQGREASLERTVTAYTETTKDFELIVLNDLPTCGQAWNAGLLQAKGEYIHLTADDIEPHFGWWEEGIKWITWNVLPCPRILNPDGSLQSCGPDAYEHDTGTLSDVARIPFFPSSLIDVLYPIFDNHYAGDYWISWKAAHSGWPTMVVREMVFTHHLLKQGRIESLDSDWEAFQEAIS